MKITGYEHQKCELACGANSTCDKVSPKGVSPDGKVYCDDEDFILLHNRDLNLEQK
jgi:hypothetical protein